MDVDYHAIEKASLIKRPQIERISPIENTTKITKESYEFYKKLCSLQSLQLKPLQVDVVKLLYKIFCYKYNLFYGIVESLLTWGVGSRLK